MAWNQSYGEAEQTDETPLTWTSSSPLLPASEATVAATQPAFTPAAVELTAPAAMPLPESMAPAALPIPNAAVQRGAGVGILLAGTGLAAGWILGGPWGAGAGFILVGAARNGWRAKQLWPSAQPADREEAAKSATMAVAGALIGGYLAYRAVRGVSQHE